MLIKEVYHDFILARTPDNLRPGLMNVKTCSWEVAPVKEGENLKILERSGKYVAVKIKKNKKEKELKVLGPVYSHESPESSLQVFESARKFGYKNADGEVIIKPVFGSTKPFVEGLALVAADTCVLADCEGYTSYADKIKPYRYFSELGPFALKPGPSPSQTEVTFGIIYNHFFVTKQGNQYHLYPKNPVDKALSILTEARDGRLFLKEIDNTGLLLKSGYDSNWKNTGIPIKNTPEITLVKAFAVRAHPRLLKATQEVNKTSFGPYNKAIIYDNFNIHAGPLNEEYKSDGHFCWLFYPQANKYIWGTRVNGKYEGPCKIVDGTTTLMGAMKNGVQ